MQHCAIYEKFTDILEEHSSPILRIKEPLTLKTGAICSSETPINFYHATKRKIPKESFLQ
jgi:hypothetical protein